MAWAYERDVATRKFLTSAGWALDGATRSLDVDDLLVPQVRLHTALAADPADEDQTLAEQGLQADGQSGPLHAPTESPAVRRA